MSQKVTTRKGAISEEKEKDKRQTDSPAKEIKKKMATSEKDKQTPEKPEKSDKQPEKIQEKHVEKEKKEQKDKKEPEKKDSPQEKKKDSPQENKKDSPQEKKKDSPPEKKEDNKIEKNGKPEKQDVKSKQNGNDVPNGVDNSQDGTVSDTDDEALIIDDEQQDELFPELAYDDSDVEAFEPPTPENLPSRSYTRRSQVKTSRTPETPRPASDKQTDRDINDDPKDKVLKLKDDTPSSDRKLRSADSPKPQDKKAPEQTKKSGESPQKAEEKPHDGQNEKSEENGVESEKEKDDKNEKLEVEVVVEIESDVSEPRKPGTNYSKSRVKVSPYRRGNRTADLTTTSLLANYTGNNTTMEMDITESSFITNEDESMNDSSYLRGLRSIRGRNSYKPLKEITLRHVTAKRSNVTSIESRPTAPVVGRKRKPDGERLSPPHEDKRLRLLDRLAAPFRRTHALTLPRRTPEIVGINTDLPLTVPVATPDTFDPETMKEDPLPTAGPIPDTEPIATPLKQDERDSKRCRVM